jgi:hypothetical protein
MDGKLDGRVEVVVAYSRYCPKVLSMGSEKTMKNLAIACAQVEIRTEHLPNTRELPLSQPARFHSVEVLGLEKETFPKFSKIIQR